MKRYIKSALQLLSAVLPAAALSACAAGGVEKSYVNTTSAPPVVVATVAPEPAPAPVILPAPPASLVAIPQPAQVAPATPPATAPAQPVAATTAAPAPATATPAAATTLAPTALAAGTKTNAAPEGELAVLDQIPPTPKQELKLAKPVAEIVKLAQSGVDDTVVLLYVDKSTEKFDLDAEEILYLHDIGVSSEVIAAMLTKDGASAELQKVLETERPNAVAEGPPVAETPTAAPLAQSAVPGAPAVEVTSNYVATAPAPLPPTQTVVVQQPAQQVVVESPAVTYSYFYPSLSPYGSWLLVDGYGWCWQPTVAVSYRGWRPYAHGGRWLFTDAGWYWHSDYSWGWAPFHYGRWFSTPRHGWVWYPDYTWGPSWVTWRRGADYCGWAPLPPHAGFHHGIGFSYFGRNVGFNFTFGLGVDHYTFVSYRRFCDRRVDRHLVPTAQNNNIYQGSTVVNNYIVGNNNTIINNGISRDVVQQHSRSEVRKVALREPATGARRPVAPDRLVQEGRELAIYRPPAPPAEAARNVPSGGRNFQEVRRPSAPASTSGRNTPSAVATPVAARQPVTAWPKPAPVTRPSAPAVSRATQEGRREPSVNSPFTAAPGGSIAPRATPSTRTPAATPSRPATPPVVGDVAPRSAQPSRPVVTPSAPPSTTAPTVRPREVPRSTAPQRLDPAMVPGSTPARQQEPVRSPSPSLQTPSPAAVPRSVPAQNPAVNRPVTPSVSTPTPSPRSEAAPRSPAVSPRSTQPPAQQAPVYQPRSVAPAPRSPAAVSPPASAPPRSEPPRSSPAPSAPVQRSSPSVSAPPPQRSSPPPSVAPAQRSSPAPAQPQPQQGRGRVEIGR